MVIQLLSAITLGVQARLVNVEVDVASQGLPMFSIVGLGDRSVMEAKERVRSAIKNSGFNFPAKRITVNLAPADLPKEGPVFDLAIALGILLAAGEIKTQIDKVLIIGELSLDGVLRSVTGGISFARLAREQGIGKVFLPLVSAKEASYIDGVLVYGFNDLKQVVNVLSDISPPPLVLKQQLEEKHPLQDVSDFAEIKGQYQAKRALTIAAAGGHNILLHGPPGTGKTMLAKAFRSILPPMSEDEMIEVSQIYSVAGLLSAENPLITQRPFRSPHHTASFAGMIGGGALIKPGEISLAHRGVLFLDEAPEFPRSILESLRQPLEEGEIVVSRASGSIRFPADFILFLAQNPCPCGYLGSKRRSCICTPHQIAWYQKKLSGPLLDRIDLKVEVPEVSLEELSLSDHGSSPEELIKGVSLARDRQNVRFKGSSTITNSQMTNLEIRQFCPLDEESLALLKGAIERLSLSVRGYQRVIKVARTIADLENFDHILPRHVAESLQYRLI